MKREEFPKYVYTKEGARLVKDQDELDTLEGDYYDSPADVPAGDDQDAALAEAKRTGRDHDIPTQPEFSKPGAGADPENAPRFPDLLADGHVERDRLEMEAKTIGLKVSKSWTDEELRRRILEKGSQ